MKTNRIIYKIILIAIILISCSTYTCYAEPFSKPETDGGGSVSSGTSESSSIHFDDYRPEINPEDTGKTIEILAKILSVLIILGTVLSVVFIAIIGFSGILGSAQERADVKQKMIGLLIGAILITSVSAIAKLIISIAEKF